MTARRSSEPRRSAGPDYARYAVIRVGERWRLLCNDTLVGRFGSREAATSVGEALCLASSALGCEAELTIQTQTGELRPVARLPPSRPAPQPLRTERA